MRRLALTDAQSECPARVLVAHPNHAVGAHQQHA